MTFSVACWCGYVFECIPPASCPNCAQPVTDGRDPATDEAWLELIRSEIGPGGSTSSDATGTWGP